MFETRGVFLVDAGRKKIPVIKVIRSELGLGLKEAKAVVDIGGVVADGLTIDRAQRLLEKLSAAGARAQLIDPTSTGSEGRASPPPLSTDHPRVSIGDEIEKLVRLRDAGALTEEEFGAAKRRVLYL
jgi:Ribosomal protein L7/L12 C-terminal domain/Short C-terminal domain